ncbi:MAG: hypothetical protein J7493_09635 [Porphyrobacter sp.]|nr:hypothetical protein [Porphyrobacter sp.]
MTDLSWVEAVDFLATVYGWAALAAALVIAAEAGYRFRWWRGVRRAAVAAEDPQGSAYVLSAALALLGLLIAFVFNLAANHYETRRQLVPLEASAISTATNHYRLLDPAVQPRLMAAMADYAKARLSFSELELDEGKIEQSRQETAAIQKRIWSEVGDAVSLPEYRHLSVPALSATTDMFDVATARHAALETRIPGRALQVLILYALVAAAIMGHSLGGSRQRHLIATTGLFALIALAINLIADLDTPRIGSVRVSQAFMERVASELAEHPSVRLGLSGERGR